MIKKDRSTTLRFSPNGSPSSLVFSGLQKFKGYHHSRTTFYTSTIIIDTVF